MTALTIWRFGTPDGAHRAAETLASLAKTELITIHDAAVVSWREDDKKPKLRQLHSLVGRGALAGAFWGMLFGLIFLMPLVGAAIGAAGGALGGSLADLGIDDDLIKKIRSQVTPGTSALLILSSDAVIDRVREAFTGQEIPELMFTNLSPEQEEALREVFTMEPDQAGSNDRQPSAQ
jgi:uncharacterized membrane protein